VYDIHKGEFSKPIHCEGVERQWHSAVYLAQRQLLIAFGGEAPDSNKGKITTLNQVMVLDTEIMLWCVRTTHLVTDVLLEDSFGPSLSLTRAPHCILSFVFILIAPTGTLLLFQVRSPLVVRVTPHPSYRTT
jgi:hypothetical protein